MAFGRGKRVICMDGLDLYETLDRHLSFADVMSRKVGTRSRLLLRLLESKWNFEFHKGSGVRRILLLRFAVFRM